MDEKKKHEVEHDPDEEREKAKDNGLSKDDEYSVEEEAAIQKRLEDLGYI